MQIEGKLRGRARAWLIRLMAVAFSLLLSFVVLEIGLRVLETMGGGGESWVVRDDEIGYRTRPGVLDTNELGLRDDPIDPVKRGFRILMLGDSIPFYGDDAADTYVGRLERLLATDHPERPRIDVINAGVKGYTTYQELLYLKKFGLDFEPDLVGVSFCFNDLHRFAHRFEFDERGNVVGQGYSFTDEAVRSVDSPLYALARKSHFLVWMRRRLAVFDSIVNLATRGGYTFDYRPDFANAWKDEPWVEIEQWLGEMSRLGKEHGFPVFVVSFPFGEQLRADYLSRDRDYVRKPQRKLGEICARLGIPYLDLFDGFDAERDLIDDRIHLTPVGRQHAAERVAEFLAARSLLPRTRESEADR